MSDEVITSRVSPSSRYRVAGDSAILVEFEEEVSLAVHQRVRALMTTLDSDPLVGLRDLIPSYCALLILYDPLQVSYDDLMAHLHQLEGLPSSEIPASRQVIIPVCYGGRFGTDLADVAAQTRLSEYDVISRHVEGEYHVYFLGFSPGYPYLGGLDPALAVPRLPSPRMRVPAGSIALANGQTGIYPQETPGGWRLIGRTPLRLYDPAATHHFLLRAGDIVRFRQIDEASFTNIEAQVAAMIYHPTIIQVDDPIAIDQ